jgi:hypothetical protein
MEQRLTKESQRVSVLEKRMSTCSGTLICRVQYMHVVAALRMTWPKKRSCVCRAENSGLENIFIS